MSNYTPTIGLEVHAELSTKSKMFCGCKNDPHGSEPNTNICPVCMAHPGTLPVVNEEAVKKVLIFGSAIKGTHSEYSEFDRKNYFYPDIPKAYQISQYQYPFIKGGEIHGIQITRVHLEEDTARSQHDQGDGSLVDFNRAGVPLMELVTEPVIHDSKVASNFARELQLILRSLSISKANMEKGEMRVEANISIAKDGEDLGTLVEIKNLNSFKAVESAIDYEILRQTKLLQNGDKVIRETRGWDEHKAKTFSQRSKETADDYRYFPDPDIPKFDIVGDIFPSSTRLDDILSKLPSKKRLLYSDLGIKRNQIEIIISNLNLDRIFSEYLDSDIPKDYYRIIANYLTSDILGIIESDISVSLDNFNTKTFLKLVSMISKSSINSRVAKDLLLDVAFKGSDPMKLASERNLLQNFSESELNNVVLEIIKANKPVALEYKSGKESSLQFFVGQGMRVTKGAADPVLLAKLFKDELNR